MRPTLDKTYERIVKRRLWRTKAQVMALCKVAVVNPSHHDDLYKLGYQYSNTKAGPNHLWKRIFAIPDGGLDTIPNEGRFYIVPVVPPGADLPMTFRRVLKPDEVSQPKVLRSVLAEHYPQRFTASDPNVLAFDSGDVIYLTDSREENRTTLEFTLEAKVERNYRCTILTQDATSCNVNFATETLRHGWRKKFVLFAGCSALLQQTTR